MRAFLYYISQVKSQTVERAPMSSYKLANTPSLAKATLSFTFEDIQSLQRSLLYSYFQVASVVILVFDHSLTLYDEIELIWERKPNRSSVLFYITRYLPYFDSALLLVQSVSTPSKGACIAVSQLKICIHIHSLYFLFDFTIVGSYFISYAAAESILILRTYAVYDNNKKLIYTLFALLAACSGLGGYLARLSYPSTTDSDLFGSIGVNFAGCSNFSTHKSFWLVYLVISIFETLILVLTAYKVTCACQGS